MYLDDSLTPEELAEANEELRTTALNTLEDRADLGRALDAWLATRQASIRAHGHDTITTPHHRASAADGACLICLDKGRTAFPLDPDSHQYHTGHWPTLSPAGRQLLIAHGFTWAQELALHRATQGQSIWERPANTVLLPPAIALAIAGIIGFASNHLETGAWLTGAATLFLTIRIILAFFRY